MSGKCRSWVQPYSSGRFLPREERRAMSLDVYKRQVRNIEIQGVLAQSFEERLLLCVVQTICLCGHVGLLIIVFDLNLADITRFQIEQQVSTRLILLRIQDVYKRQSGGYVRPACFSTGRLSPVKALSSAFKSCASVNRRSAGTKSPAFNRTRSPGTISAAARFRSIPSRIRCV